MKQLLAMFLSMCVFSTSSFAMIQQAKIVSYSRMLQVDDKNEQLNQLADEIDEDIVYTKENPSTGKSQTNETIKIARIENKLKKKAETLKRLLERSLKRTEIKDFENSAIELKKSVDDAERKGEISDFSQRVQTLTDPSIDLDTRKSEFLSIYMKLYTLSIPTTSKLIYKSGGFKKYIKSFMKSLERIETASVQKESNYRKLASDCWGIAIPLGLLSVVGGLSLCALGTVFFSIFGGIIAIIGFFIFCFGGYVLCNVKTKGNLQVVYV